MQLKNAALSQKDTLLGNTYHEIAMFYLHDERNIDSAIRYETMALRIAEKHDRVSRIVNSKMNIGDALVQKEKFDLAKKEFEDAQKIASERNYRKGVIDANNALGYFYAQLDQPEKSIVYFVNTAKEYELLHDNNRLAYTYINIAMTFGMMEQQDKSLVFIDKALTLIPKLDQRKDAKTIVHIYSQAGDNYMRLSETSQNSKLLEKALAYADSCLKISERNKVNRGLAGAYFIKCTYYNSTKDYRSALLNGKKGLTYRASMPQENILDFHLIIARSLIELKDYSAAQAYVDSCRLNEKSAELDNPLHIAQLEYSLLKNTGNNAGALAALEKVLAQKEKIFDLKKNKVINDLESKYQNGIKESIINKLNQQTEIDNLRIRSLIAVSAVAILLVIVIIFFFRQNIIKNKMKTMEIEQRLNRARMNPHFFFNALTSLQALSIQKDKTELVPEFISKFSKIMRQSLESTFNEMDTLENEILFLKDYLEVQKIRSENRFDYEFNIDENIEQDETLIPSMILQPFIENSIEHGFKDINYKGNISVSVTKQNGFMNIIIRDNGRGELDKGREKAYPSRATQIIQDRLFLLNKKQKTNANFVVRKPTDMNGTEVMIYLPIVYKNESTNH